MRLERKKAVPDHYRRAVRLGLAVLVLSAAGFTLIGHPGYESHVMVLKWGCLTLPVVTMPLLGKTSQVGFERVLGTIIGGLLGALADGLATRWWTLPATETNDFGVAAVAAALAAWSVLLGKRYSLDLSAKLFVIAFLLVAFSSQQGQDPVQVAVTRVGGITLGVLTMLLCSIVILPKSASVEALRTLCKSLERLQEVNRAAWGSYLPDGPQEAPPDQQSVQPEPQAAATRAPSEAGSAAKATPRRWMQQRQGNGAAPREDSALTAPLLAAAADLEAGRAGAAGAAAPVAEEVVEEARMLMCEKALTKLYKQLDKLEEQLGLARTEVWVASCGGHPFILPGLPFCGMHTNHLPWEELEAAANAIRRVARLLNTALFTFNGGFDKQLQEVLGPFYPSTLLPALAAGADATIQELCAAFPGQTKAGTAGLDAFSNSVLALVEVSDQQRREAVAAVRRLRSRTTARDSWAHLIDSVLHHRPSGGLPNGGDQKEQQPQQEGQQAAGGSQDAEEEGFYTPGSMSSAALSTAGEVATATAGGAGAAPVVRPEVTDADVVSNASGSGQPALTQEVSLSAWLRRMSSVGRSVGRHDTAAAAAAAAAAADEATERSSVAGSDISSARATPLRLASEAAGAGQQRGLSAVLEGTPPVPSPLGRPPSSQLSRPSTTPSPVPSSLPPSRTPSLQRLQQQQQEHRVEASGNVASPVVPPLRFPGATPRTGPPALAGPPVLSRASVLSAANDGSMPQMPLLLFPDTPEGHLTQAKRCLPLLQHLPGNSWHPMTA